MVVMTPDDEDIEAAAERLCAHVDAEIVASLCVRMSTPVVWVRWRRVDRRTADRLYDYPPRMVLVPATPFDMTDQRVVITNADIEAAFAAPSILVKATSED